MKEILAALIMCGSFLIRLIGGSRLVVRLGYTLIGVVMGFSTFLFGSLLRLICVAE